jgi:hypothetical protein
VCVVTTSWTLEFRFSAPKCDHHTKRSDITCWIYSTHTASEMYEGLKSFQTKTENSLSFVYFLVFVCFSYKKSHNLYDTNELSFIKWIIKLNKRNKFFYLDFILPSCSVILPNPPCNNVVGSITFKFLLVINIFTRKSSVILIN